MSPEEKARRDIDRQLIDCGWIVQNREERNAVRRDSRRGNEP